uniref:Anthocyanin 5-aromatic acyltransferase n=2 Tax=Cajanus cajan TaxID=3821 RepID=A0A151SCI4_CAJCA|nr:Anthocyanin 5-aromatic acyltransferase [Cajanus cajan]
MIRDPSGIGEAYANSWLNFGGEANNRSLKAWGSLDGVQNDVVKGFFELGPSHIQKLKKLAESKVVGKKVKVTSFSVTCGYVLACAVKVDTPKRDKAAFVITVDCRGRLDAVISETYFGNCVVPKMVVVEKSELLGEDGFVKGVEGISEVLRGLEESGALHDAENWMKKIQGVLGDRLFSVAGSPRFEVYGIDFGFGRPKKVDVTSIDKTGAFSLSECRDQGGIEIGLALTKDQMEEFSRLFNQGLESLLE